ncbi:MAG: diguanylate cyclase [Synergistaceae bacterium]|nr:diguanylate cyclase [Synergistaceae bacterium]
MYSCDLTIQTAGLDESLIEVMRGIKPLAGFTHAFQSFESLADLSLRGPALARTQDVAVIVDETSARRDMRKFVPKLYSPIGGAAFRNKRVKRILCTSDVSALNEEELTGLFDVWAKPLTPASLTFYFTRLQSQIKEEKDSWLWRTWLEQTIDPLPDLVWFKDTKGEYLKVNKAFTEVAGQMRAGFRETDMEVQRTGRTAVFNEQIRGPEGARQLKTYKTPIFSEDGAIIGTVGVARDVTKEQEFQRQILEMAQQDYLTGLATRWYFQEFVDKNKEEKHVTCVYFDLDHFKELNDTYGHLAGDNALAVTAEMMQREFPDGFLARLGGDEFMAVLLGERALKGVEKRINLFLDRLMRYYHDTTTMQKLSVSAGISQGEPGSSKSIDRLIHESDLALYQAKRAGRACCRVYDPSMEQQNN